MPDFSVAMVDPSDEILLTMRRNSTNGGVVDGGKRTGAAGTSTGGRPSNAHRDPFLSAIAEEKVGSLAFAYSLLLRLRRVGESGALPSFRQCHQHRHISQSLICFPIANTDLCLYPPTNLYRRTSSVAPQT